MANPSPMPCCSFCTVGIRDLGDSELLHVSKVGGQPPMICSRCVAGFHQLDELHARAPDLAATLLSAGIRAHTAVEFKIARQDTQS